MQTPYTQHEGKAVSADETYKHVMAIALDPRTNFREGVIRCITSREGDVKVKGYTDWSELHLVKGDSLEQFVIGEKLKLKYEDIILEKIMNESGPGLECIGFEDPDIWIDEATDMLHLYFTIPLINKDDHNKNKIHLGHAVGKDLSSLEMVMPVLMGGAKELSIAPVNKLGFRLNLVESADKVGFTNYSVVKTAFAEDMNGPWKFGDIIFHPKTNKIPWIGEHASPGPLFSKNFIDVGESKLLGIINGREASTEEEGRTWYGTFSVGLFIYDYERGEIVWVSHEPFIQDTEAKTITFASQFVETGPGEGILYAHVDDSFVRAYSLNAAAMKELLPK